MLRFQRVSAGRGAYGGVVLATVLCVVSSVASAQVDLRHASHTSPFNQVSNAPSVGSLVAASGSPSSGSSIFGGNYSIRWLRCQNDANIAVGSNVIPTTAAPTTELTGKCRVIGNAVTLRNGVNDRTISATTGGTAAGSTSRSGNSNNPLPTGVNTPRYTVHINDLGSQLRLLMVTPGIAFVSNPIAVAAEIRISPATSMARIGTMLTFRGAFPASSTLPATGLQYRIFRCNSATMGTAYTPLTSTQRSAFGTPGRCTELAQATSRDTNFGTGKPRIIPADSIPTLQLIAQDFGKHLYFAASTSSVFSVAPVYTLPAAPPDEPVVTIEETYWNSSGATRYWRPGASGSKVSTTACPAGDAASAAAICTEVPNARGALHIKAVHTKNVSSTNINGLSYRTAPVGGGYSGQHDFFTDVAGLRHTGNHCTAYSGNTRTCYSAASGELHNSGLVAGQHRLNVQYQANQYDFNLPVTALGGRDNPLSFPNPVARISGEPTIGTPVSVRIEGVPNGASMKYWLIACTNRDESTCTDAENIRAATVTASTTDLSATFTLGQPESGVGARAVGKYIRGAVKVGSAPTILSDFLSTEVAKVPFAVSISGTPFVGSEVTVNITPTPTSGTWKFWVIGCTTSVEANCEDQNNDNRRVNNPTGDVSVASHTFTLSTRAPGKYLRGVVKVGASTDFVYSPFLSTTLTVQQPAPSLTLSGVGVLGDATNGYRVDQRSTLNSPNWETEFLFEWQGESDTDYTLYHSRDSSTPMQNELGGGMPNYPGVLGRNSWGLVCDAQTGTVPCNYPTQARFYAGGRFFPVTGTHYLSITTTHGSIESPPNTVTLVVYNNESPMVVEPAEPDETLRLRPQGDLSTGTLQASFSDSDSGSTMDMAGGLTCSASSNPESVATVPATCTLTETSTAGTFSTEITVTAVGLGQAVVTVTAEDTAGRTVGKEFMVRVNTPPTAGEAPEELTLTVGDTENNTRRANFSDGDDTLTYSAEITATEPTGVIRIDTNADSGVVTVTPVAVGEATVTITATDPAGERATQAFMVTVNAPPAAASSGGGSGAVVAVVLLGGAYLWWKKRQAAKTGDVAALAMLPDVSFELDRSDRRAFYTRFNWQSPAHSNWQVQGNATMHTKYSGKLLDWNADSHIGYRLNGKLGEFNPYMNAKFVQNAPENAKMDETYTLGVNYAMPSRFGVQFLQPDDQIWRYSINTQVYLPRGISLNFTQPNSDIWRYSTQMNWQISERVGLSLTQPNNDLDTYGFGVQWHGDSKIRYGISGETGRNSYRFSGQFSF